MRSPVTCSATSRAALVVAVVMAILAVTPLRAMDVAAPSNAWRAEAGPATARLEASVASRIAAAGDDELVPPPVIDPKSVETRPVTPGADRPFGREEVLASVPVISLSGTANWDDAYDVLVDAMKTLAGELKALGLTQTGHVRVVYTQSDDERFTYEVEMPFSGVTAKKPAGGMRLGASYAGKVIRFSHSGAFMDMDNTYELIANYLDEKNINADQSYMEEYITDLVTTPPDALKIDILVPVP